MHIKLREIHIKFQLSIIREVGDISIFSWWIFIFDIFYANKLQHCFDSWTVRQQCNLGEIIIVSEWGFILDIFHATKLHCYGKWQQCKLFQGSLQWFRLITTAVRALAAHRHSWLVDSRYCQDNQNNAIFTASKYLPTFYFLLLSIMPY